jgi:hypothetical protein
MFIKCVGVPSFPHYFCPLIVLWIQRLDSYNLKPTFDIFLDNNWFKLLFTQLANVHLLGS